MNTLVSSGLGMALMIEDEAQDAVAEGRVTIWDQKIESIDLSFVYPRNRSSDPMVKAVVEAICKVWEVCDRIAK